MYKHYETLTTEEVDKLIKLSRRVKFRNATGSRVRIGQNKEKALSVYRYSKWFDWLAADRENFRVGFTKEALSKVIQGWFLDIPPEKGFLDVMTTWVGKPSSGTVICTALKDNQTIFIDNKAVELSKGEQIGFSLCSVHSIPKSVKGQLWACIMIRGDHNKLD